MKAANHEAQLTQELLQVRRQLDHFKQKALAERRRLYYWQKAALT